MITVTDAEFQKHFGRYLDAAQREPVTITSDGREHVVLISAAAYAEYRALKDSRRQVQHVSEMTDEELKVMMACKPPPETAQFDHEDDWEEDDTKPAWA